MPKKDAEKIKTARTRWTSCSEAEDAQRKRIVLAKKFRALDQWPSAIKLAREGAGSITGQGPAPARPCLVVDRLSQPVRQVSNTIKNADFGFDVLPNGQGADTETADIFKGYLRRVQNQSRGESPIEWAADGAIEGGIGWCRLRTEFVHERWDGVPTEEVFDQELRLERITNNLTVYCDPNATSPTRRDAKYMFVTEDLSRDEFERLYPEADFAALNLFETTGDGKSLPGWVDKDTIRIAEYWYIDYKKVPYWWSVDGQIFEGKPPKDAQVRMERVMQTPEVKGCKINACEVLEEWDWVGSRIPLFPVLGEELNIDGKPWLRGIIEMGMDAQRMINYTYSAGVEIFALSSRKAPMVPMSAIANYKNIWDSRTTTSWSYWPYDAYDDTGRPQPAPLFDPTEAPIQAATMLMRTSEEAVKASTSTGDASLGNSNPNERSGKALNALQAQSDLANSNYPDNVRRALIEIANEAVIVIPKITRPGQILHIMGLDDQPEQVMVGKPFKPGANGVPEAAPDDVTPEVAKLKESLFKFYDLNQGTYAVTVTVGKATATRREEGAAALGELIPHLPPEMQIKVMPDYIKQLSFPGAQGIAEKLEPPKGDESMPPQAQQMIQQLQQQLQQATQMIQTDQAKQQGQIQTAQLKAQSDSQAAQLREQGEMQRAQIDAQVKIQIAEMDNRTKLTIEEWKLRGTMMQAEFDAQQAQLGAAQSAQSDAVGRETEMVEAERSRQHESGEAQAAREAAEAQQAAGMSHEAEQAELARQAAEQQAAQAAAVQGPSA